MTSPDTINETLAMLRRRLVEIDRLVKELERKDTTVRKLAKAGRR